MIKTIRPILFASSALVAASVVATALSLTISVVKNHGEGFPILEHEVDHYHITPIPASPFAIYDALSVSK